MELADLTNHVPDFGHLPQVDKVKVFAWYLHVHKRKEHFTSTDIRQCHETLHLEPPNVSDILAKLALRKPRVLLRTGSQFKLEMRVRQELETKYGTRPISIAVEQSLAELPVRISDETKRKYYVEALNCYKSKCFRAAILMSWNLAYDHLLNWVLSNPSRLAKFNTELPSKPPFVLATGAVGMTIAKREDFERLGEHEVITICGHKNVAIISDNVKKILVECLQWRNMSAHPSTIEVKQVTAEHTILNLVENVVLHLV